MKTSDFWWKKKDLPKSCPDCGIEVKFKSTATTFAEALDEWWSGCHAQRYLDEHWGYYRWGIECRACEMRDAWKRSSTWIESLNTEWEGTTKNNSIKIGEIGE